MTASSSPELPAPRAPGRGARYSIAFVCLGNICRSPIAEAVLSRKLERAGLDQSVAVRSAGTGDWHVGDPMDRRAAAILVEHGYDPTRHRAAQFDAAWFDQHDLVLAMDQANLRDLQGLARTESERERVVLFRAFDPVVEESLDVPDPWYGGDDGFQTVLSIVERTGDALVDALAAYLPGDRDDALG